MMIFRILNVHRVFWFELQVIMTNKMVVIHELLDVPAFKMM
jgi:hypothetical protein